MEGEKEPAEGISIGSYPMLFGISCACVAIDLVARRSRVLDIEKGRRRASSAAETMLKASAQLLGLVVLDRAQRKGEALEGELKRAEMKIEELKTRRTEDAKANEKVVGIFAAHEQRWIAERKLLRMQVRALANEARVAKAKHEEAVSSLSKRLEDEERLVLLKEEALEEETRKRKELEIKLQAAEDAVDELREKAKKEAQDHATELWKHRTGLVELASSQRRTEAELGRALGQVALVKQELHEALARRQEALALVEKLSAEVVKTQQDSEQKDKILSAMLRKSKLDSAEKQMLMKEMKVAKARKKQAEMEAQRCRNMSRHIKSSTGLRSADPGHHGRMELQLNSNKYYQGKNTFVVDHVEAEGRKEGRDNSVQCSDQYSSDGNGDSGTSLDECFPQLGDWVRTEMEKCEAVIKQKHYTEIEAFTEQMRQKDEKLEACRWRIQSMELESKKLRSHVKGLDENLSRFQEENIKLEALLLDKERELQSLKEQFNLHVQKLHECKASQVQAQCQEVRISRRKSGLVRDTQMTKKLVTKSDVQNASKDAASSFLLLDSNKEREIMCRESRAIDTKASSSTGSSSPDKKFQDIPDECSTTFPQAQPKSAKNTCGQQVKNKYLESNYANGDAEEVKEVKIDQASADRHNGFQDDANVADKFLSAESSLLRKDSSWKMDIHALAISYKIKRMKQQLHALENLVVPQKTKLLQPATDGVPPSAADGSNNRCDNSHQTKGIHLMKSLLTKQLKRYQSLEEKTDDLCRRVQDIYPSGSQRELRNGRTKEQTTTLERLLEETFRLQRVVVATGQKLAEIQSRIASSLSFAVQLESVGFNMEQFSDVVRTLFREIQRGLEVRIARIIGDLEGTLACDGILHR